MKKGQARADRVLAEERVPYLTDRERKSLARFLERLEAECGDRVQRVVLFGSRARGDHEAESDVDLLDIALSRAYYACFYALTAALYAINVVRGKHSGVQAALSQFLVKPGLVEPEYKDIYNALKGKRESSDYDPRFVADPDEARKLLGDAERFVARMEAFLRERGALVEHLSQGDEP